MAIPRPRGRIERWARLTGDLALPCVSAYIIIVSAPNCPPQLWISAVIVGLIGIAHAYSDYQRTEQHSIHPLDASLETLFTVLAGSDIDKAIGLRICLHRVDGSTLTQVTEYVGEAQGASPKARRTFSVHCGIIGKAVRHNSAQFATRQNEDAGAFIEELVGDWAYDVDTARKITPDRKSWAAIPISADNRRIEAVLYCDARAKTFFNEDRQEMLINACMGLAQYVRKRYV